MRCLGLLRVRVLFSLAWVNIGGDVAIVSPAPAYPPAGDTPVFGVAPDRQALAKAIVQSN